jgi:hypothetical protein
MKATLPLQHLTVLQLPLKLSAHSAKGANNPVRCDEALVHVFRHYELIWFSFWSAACVEISLIIRTEKYN